ncbi:hypothetical protein H0H87_004669 [Tephrocybe sp. NHM501043]|nr:hypothetical protein H0H87_004669 [Tephrocybe sp. NHM501043]
MYTNTMDAFNTLDPMHDPFMAALSTIDPTTTFFDPFAPIPSWPWTLGPKLHDPKWDEPSLQLTQTQLDVFKRELASPVPSPALFLFEIEVDTTNYEPCYDEFRETKLSVVKELSEQVKAIPAIEEPLRESSSEVALSVDPLGTLFEGAYTLPDNFLDDLYQEMNLPFDSYVASPCPSLSTSSSPSNASTISVVSPPSSTFAFSSSTITEPKASTSWLDAWDLKSVDDNLKDDGYQPFEASYAYPQTPLRKNAFKTQSERPQQLQRQFSLSAKGFPETPTKPKRKAAPLACESKRQKLDPDVVCRVYGCRHIAKTRFECQKHRETHFPGRFKCPHPSCQKVFVRSSSLARHLKRPRNAQCMSYAGAQQDWGVGLKDFSLHPPKWEEPGFLDDISEE